MSESEQDIYKGLRVLIVDDEKEFAQTLASRLELRDMVVRCAFGGREGVRALSEELPDVLLLDMRMPGFSGLDVLSVLRRERAIAGGERLPVVLVSAHAEAQDFQRAKELGIQGSVAKPVQFPDLLEAIGQALNGG